MAKLERMRFTERDPDSIAESLSTAVINIVKQLAADSRFDESGSHRALALMLMNATKHREILAQNSRSNNT